MASSLIIPRCEVLWGNVNLTHYPLAGGEPQALVFDVRVSQQDSGETPSGSMRWNPTGAAFAVYEELLKSSISKTITVRFYYVNGRSVTFSFVWSGQTEVYGNEMSLEVKLASQLDGLVNANIKSTAQVDDKGTLFDKTISQIDKSFGVDGYNLIQYSGQAFEDLKIPKVLSNYSIGSTYAESVKNLAEQTGHLVMSTNIVAPEGGKKLGGNMVVLGPYKTDTKPIQELSPQAQFPDTSVRYGYFLGPGIINTITKTSEWQPPQKTQTSLDSTQAKLESPNPTTQGQPTSTSPQAAAQQAQEKAKGKGGASNAASSSARPGARLKDNAEGESRKLAIQQERSSKLSASLFMCPALTGIKPMDIIFISNYSGTFLEDWLVNSVDYTQMDGGVEISIQASREYGLGNLMNKKLGEPWAEKAKAKNLVGPTGTLEGWQEYAWGALGFQSRSPSAQTSKTASAFPSNSFSMFAKSFGKDQTLITDRGFYDYLTKYLSVPAVNGSGVLNAPIGRIQELYKLYLEGR